MELMSRPREARLSQQRKPQKQNDYIAEPAKLQSLRAQGFPLISLDEKGEVRLTWENWWSVHAGSGCSLCPPLHRCGPPPASPLPPPPRGPPPLQQETGGLVSAREQRRLAPATENKGFSEVNILNMSLLCPQRPGSQA